MEMMRNMTMAVILAVAMACEGRAALVTVNTFNDILFWTGSGTNEAALVLQFPTTSGTGAAPVTPISIAWGYRWNGSATMADMVFSLAGNIVDGPAPVAGSDPRLAIQVSDWGVPPNTDYFMDSVTYSQSGLPDGWSPVTREMPGWDGSSWIALYTLAGSGSWTGDSFTLSDFGMSSIAMDDGDWYGFVQLNGPSSFAFTQPVSAVPEPSTWAMLAGGAAAWIAWRRRRARSA